MNAEFEEQIVYHAALSWRDVGRMVNDSETRLTKRIDEWGERVSKVVEDHETRLSAEEEFTVGVRSSTGTAERFFAFGKWVLATAIAICGVAIAALSKLSP